ncbi:MAG: acetoacetate decarboxylase family protein [Rhodospirillaceae bacterium]|nr:acetoacetate decarboxylase family protein [Rhodospirillaceae bacterium]
MTLKGFTRPFTPQGHASIIPPLPWRFAGDLYVVHFKADPAALNALIPAPLAPSEIPGQAFLWSVHFAVYPDVDGAEQALNPARSQYNVCVIGVPCMFQGKPRMLSAFQWCDKDWLVVLSWFIGAASKGAEIIESKSHPLLAATGSPQTGGVGTRINRTVSRNGDRIVSFSLSPKRVIGPKDMTFFAGRLPLLSVRHVPDLHVPPRGRPDLHDICEQLMGDTQFGEIRAGDATLEFGASDNEDLLPIQPTEVLGGYVMPMGFKLRGIRVVHDYLAR